MDKSNNRVLINQNMFGHSKENCIAIQMGNHTASWKRHGDGVANIQFEATGLSAEKPAAGWLSIIASETAFADQYKDNSRDVTKEVTLSIGLPGMRALRDMLNGLDLGDE